MYYYSCTYTCQVEFFSLFKEHSVDQQASPLSRRKLTKNPSRVCPPTPNRNTGTSEPPSDLSQTICFSRRILIMDLNTTGRTLVVCFDGTNNKLSTKNSNVVHFFSCLKRDDPSQQLVYYQVSLLDCGEVPMLTVR